MADTRSYPDISFVDTNTETITNALIQAYELFTGRTLYPADPARLFILWAADIIIQERVLINESAKRNVPRYAEGEYLDSLAEIFKDTYRLEATAAQTTFRCYITAPQAGQTLIPAGTRITVDGEITFETTQGMYIPAGSLYIDIPAVCQTAGTVGNDFIPGQITQIVDVYPFYDKVENITTSAGGAEEETDAAFYERIRESMESFSTAGPSGAYIYYAKTASNEITDVSADCTTPGIADIRVLCINGELPTEEIINKVQAILSADRTRPMTDSVNVAVPDTVPFDIDLTYYIPLLSANSAAVIAADVAKAVTEYKKWQTEKMGRDINPSYLNYLLMKTGIKRAEIRSPAYTAIAKNEVAVLNQEAIISGGTEDE
jgi:phage-related baseplate assembly protein